MRNATMRNATMRNTTMRKTNKKRPVMRNTTMRNTYKNRPLMRKTTMHKTQHGGNVFIFDAAKIHPASINLGNKFVILPSTIHGVGVFANKNIDKNEIIHCAIHINKITDDFGVYINHSSLNDNAELIKLSDGDYYVIANKFIPKNTEILVNYDGKTIPPFIAGSKPNYKP